MSEKAKQTATYDDDTYDYARLWINDQIDGGNDELMADADRYTDDLARTVQKCVEDWIDDRVYGRPLLHTLSKLDQEKRR